MADSTETAATVEQPKPKGTGPAITSLVIADLEQRTRLGIQRYGEALRAFNGRDPLVDLYQELLDGAQYVRQVLAEKYLPQRGYQLLADAVVAFRLDEGDRPAHFDARQWCNDAIAVLDGRPPASLDPNEEWLRKVVRDAGRSRDAALERLRRANRVGDVVGEIRDWQRATFPHPTFSGAFAHLRREVFEIDAIAGDAGKPETNAKLLEELADVVFLVLQATDALGGDLAQELEQKLAKNRTRTWKKPDSQGVIEHLSKGEVESNRSWARFVARPEEQRYQHRESKEVVVIVDDSTLFHTGPNTWVRLIQYAEIDDECSPPEVKNPDNPDVYGRTEDDFNAAFVPYPTGSSDAPAA